MLDAVREGKTITKIAQVAQRPHPSHRGAADAGPAAGSRRIEDITEQRRAEEQLREQKLQLDTALNNMSQGLNMFDAAGRLVVCNERYLQMYRLSPDDVKPGCTVRRPGPGPHRQRHVLRRRPGAVRRRAAWRR